MVRKLFIVAQGNVVVYRQLHITVGREPDVEIIYDRRPVERKPRRIDRFLRPLKRLVGQRSNATVLERLDRRQQQAIADELAKKGFVVVRVDESGQRGSSKRPESKARLVVESGDTRLGIVSAAGAGDPGSKDLLEQLEEEERSAF